MAELDQVMYRAEKLLHPERVALDEEELARFLEQEVRVLEEARQRRERAQKYEKAATLLAELVEKAKATDGEEKVAMENAANKLKEYFAAKGMVPPEPTPETEPTSGEGQSSNL